MTKTLEYGFKLACESFTKVLSVYYPGGYLRTRKQVMEEIKKAKKNGDIPKNSKPKIFKITVETLE